MKKIVKFGNKTLQNFYVNLSFEEKFRFLEIRNLAQLLEKTKTLYPVFPKIGLFPQLPQETTINIGPLTFFDEENMNSVQIGQDFIIFSFKEYSSWRKELKKILSFLKIASEELSLPKIRKIVMTYVNQFKIPKFDFNFNDYFSYPIFDKSVGWNTHFHDIFLGIVPYEETTETKIKKKGVLRFKSGVAIQEDLIFNLESVFSYENISVDCSNGLLVTYLDDAHRCVIDIFVTFITENYREILELEIDDYNS